MPDAVYLGLHYTDLELIKWQTRAVSGPFRVANDATAYPINSANGLRNTPGDWTRITGNKTSWEGSGKASDRYTNYQKGALNAPLVKDDGSTAPLTAGAKIRDAAFYYLVTDNAVGKRNVLTELIAIINTKYAYTVNGVTTMLYAFDPTNTLRWHANLSDVSPWFVITEWLTKLLYAYDYCKSEAEDGEKSTILSWHAGFLQVTKRQMDHDLADLFVNRYGNDYTIQGSTTSSSSVAYRELHHISSDGVTPYDNNVYYGGKIGSVIANRYNNRRITINTYQVLGGIATGNQVYVDSGKRFFKETIRFAMLPGATANSDLPLSDFGRWVDHDGLDPNKGYNYCVSPGMYVVADALARKGDRELWDYATTLGTSIAQSGSSNSSDGVTVKSLNAYCKYMIALKRGTKLRYASATLTTDANRLIRGYSVALDRYTVLDIIYNLAYIYSRESIFYDSAARTGTGELALPPTAQSMGSNQPWEIGHFPGTLFMFGLPASWPVVHPTIGTVLLPQNLTVPALSNVLYTAGAVAFVPIASSGLTPSIAVTAGASLVSISGGLLSFKGVGSVTIVVSQGGNGTYAAATPVSRTFTISKATVVVSCNAAERRYNETEPPFSATYAGFKTGEDASVINTLPSFSTNAVLSSNAGSYTITASGAADDHYDFTYATAVLTVKKRELTVAITNANLNLLSGGLAVQLTYTVVDRILATPVAITPTFSRQSGTSATVTSGGLVTPDAAITGTTVVLMTTPTHVNYFQITNYVRNVVVTAVSKTAQAITGFAPTTPVTIGSGSVTLPGTGGASGNPVVYTSSDPTVFSCTGTNGATGTPVSVGSAVIYANQVGNASFEDAPQVQVTITVAKKALVIVIAGQARQYKQANPVFTFTVTGGFLSGETAADIDVQPTLNANDTTTSAPGTYVISGSGASDAKYSFTYDNGDLVISKADKTIDFGSLASHPVGDPPFLLSGAASSGEAVTYVSGTPSVASISGATATPVSAGSTLITASSAASTNYNAATPVAQTLVITAALPLPQFITLVPVGTNKKYGDAPFALHASVPSNLPVTIEVISGPATWNAGTGLLTLTGATDASTEEKVKIKASQAGNGTWAAAPDVYDEFPVAKADQFLTFPAFPNRSVGELFTAVVTASSGETVVLESGNAVLTKQSETSFLPATVGTAVLQATQAGNANYNAVTDSRTFEVVADASTEVSVLDGLRPWASKRRVTDANGNVYTEYQWYFSNVAANFEIRRMFLRSGNGLLKNVLRGAKFYRSVSGVKTLIPELTITGNTQFVVDRSLVTPVVSNDAFWVTSQQRLDAIDQLIVYAVIS